MQTPSDAAHTAFIDAIKRGDETAVEAVLSGHPDLLDRPTSDGLHPAVLAMYYGKAPIAELLVRRGARLGAFGAATVGQVDEIRRALEADPSSVRAYSSDGWTLLHLATHFGHRAIVELLLDAGADTEALARNTQANTPLQAALAGGQPSVVELLLDRGADPNGAREDGLTPLHLAAMIGDPELARLLVERGASIDTPTRDGETAHDLALKGGHEAVSEMLQQRTSA